LSDGPGSRGKSHPNPDARNRSAAVTDDELSTVWDDKEEGHWAAQFVRAALDGDWIALDRVDKKTNGSKSDLAFYPTKKNPYIFQMWQAADRIDKVPWIREMLEENHIIADRHSIDAMAYGLVDGCDLSWLLAMDKLYHPTNLNIVIIGKPFPRPGEVPDLNERDDSFQQRVRDAYEGLALLFPDKIELLDVEWYRSSTDPLRSIWLVHGRICKIVNDRLDLNVPPLTLEQVGDVMTEISREKMHAKAV
jgi:thymidylate kinase